MHKFLRDVTTMTGKAFRAGMPVPEGFSTPAGLAEMVRAGDIEEVGVKVAPVEEVVVVAPLSEDGPVVVPPGTLTSAEIYALCDKAGISPDSLELGGPENMTPAKVKAAIKKAVAAKKATK